MTARPRASCGSSPPRSEATASRDAEGRIRPLLFTAKVEGDFDRIDFMTLRSRALEPGQNGAITTGSAALRLGSTSMRTLDLKAAMLDVDALAGAQSRDMLRQAGNLGVAASLLALLPADMSLAGKLNVTALKTGGQNLDNVELDVDADRDSSASGGSPRACPAARACCSPASFKGRSGPELNGELALETSDLRELTFWLWQEGRQRLGSLWTGSRGRLKMQTDISPHARRRLRSPTPSSNSTASAARARCR